MFKVNVCLSNWAGARQELPVTPIFHWCTTVKVAHSSLLVADFFLLADMTENELDQ